MIKIRCLLAVCGIACGLTAAPVLAQEAPGTSQTEESIRVNSDEAIPVGPFLFSPAIQLSWQDRDNIFFTPDDPVQDQVYLAKARFLFEVPIFESYLQFSYTPEYRDYKDYDLEDKWAHFVDVAGAFEFPSGLRLNLGYNYIVGNLEVREVDPGGELVWGDREFTKNFAAVGGDYFITQTDGLNFEMSWADVDHEDPDLFYDYTSLTAAAGWLHQLSPILVMTLNYGYNRYDAKNQEEYSDAFHDSTSDQIAFGLRGQLSPVVATEGTIGYRRTKYDSEPGDPPTEDFSGVIANGWISWDMGHGSEVRLDVLREPYPSNYGPNSNYVATGASLMYSYDRGTFFGQLRGRYQNNDYNFADPPSDIVRSDDIATFGLGLGIRFNPFLSLWGTYLYEDRDSTIYEASYKTNIYSLGLVFGY